MSPLAPSVLVTIRAGVARLTVGKSAHGAPKAEGIMAEGRLSARGKPHRRVTGAGARATL